MRRLIHVSGRLPLPNRTIESSTSTHGPDLWKAATDVGRERYIKRAALTRVRTPVQQTAPFPHIPLTNICSVLFSSDAKPLDLHHPLLRHDFTTFVRHLHTHTPHRSLSSQAAELSRLRDLINELNSTNSKTEKQSILQRYEELWPLLEFLFHPKLRLHVRPHSLIKHLKNKRTSTVLSEPTPARLNVTDLSVQTILRSLNDRVYTGNEALELLVQFLNDTGVLQEAQRDVQQDSLTLVDVFCRLLDRNLKAGVNESIVRTAIAHSGSSSASTTSSPSTAAKEEPFGVALGKPVNIKTVEKILSPTSDEGEKSWFISRKLDGVRCILQVNLDLPSKGQSSSSSSVHVRSVKALSRSGRSFSSLDVLTDYVAWCIRHSPSAMIDVVRHAKQLGQDLSPSDDESTARLYLDGELCMLVRQAIHADDGSRAKLSDSSDLPITEDFKAIVGPVMRKDQSIDNPAFFPFDLLTYDEFHRWRTKRFRHEPFYKRIERVEAFVANCSLPGPKSDEAIVRRLEQTRIHNLDEVHTWMQKAAEHGWEGLILRQGGAYEGKRRYVICQCPLRLHH